MTQDNNSSEDTSDNGSDELYEHHRFIADKGQQPLRVDKYLMNRIENATRNKIQKAAKDGNIFVNDVAVKSNYKVKPNDLVTVLFEHPPYEYLLTPENIPLDIVYEDDVCLVVNKPPGMVVHPGHGNYSGTLINALTYHFDNLPNNSSNRPGLVHRIDKDTSGLLVIAKTEEAMVHLSKQFFKKTTEREYIALVWGNIEEDEGTIEGNIGRHPKNRLQNTVFEGEDADEKGKHAVTHFKVLERLGYVTFVSCRLETGRTHQIRVHLKYIGHTLFNDERYGGERILKGTTFSKYKQFVENCFKVLPRQALHARTLGFKHPVSGEMMRFEAPIPDDISACLERWRNYSKHVIE
ncbi:RluA family pseudouridine synthase [Cochleicola gelatinilyticus]|uniref:Pseudouridine synthase n=1 Tax=Cochleicola gelatinilyticus TaxID=1763537 RepID=A0A167KBI4_9FLAO|nr:RluA family pseudouridine synthase [Cochleicola gelatinilyticus]OAB81694.1 RNA pseudouridine synthase [Cochleicola gelatinilyticus]